MHAGAVALVLVASVARAVAAPAPLVAVVAAHDADDVRQALVIGAGGEVYEPDGKGAWVHRLPSSTAGALDAAGRAGGVVVASGDGAIYRLADNGWSAIRLVQHGRAILGSGTRALAAVGRQVFSLDGLTKGEPTKLATAPGNVVALAAGAKAMVVATDAGVFRIEGGKPVAIKAAPRRLRLISERWAIVERGALELSTGTAMPWPSGLTIGPAATTPDEALVAVATGRAGLELVVLRNATLSRDPLGLSGTAVAVTVDRAGRALVVLADGRLAVRGQAGWTTTQVRDEPSAPHPGAPPATSM